MNKYKVAFNYKKGQRPTYVSEICIMVQGLSEGLLEEQLIDAELRTIKQNIAEMKFRRNFRGDSLMMQIDGKALHIYNRTRPDVVLTIIFEPIK